LATANGMMGPKERAAAHALRSVGMRRDKPSNVGRLRLSFVSPAHALDNKGSADRVVELAGEDFLVFEAIVPTLERRLVGEFQDDDAFRLRPFLISSVAPARARKRPPYFSIVAPTAAR